MISAGCRDRKIEFDVSDIDVYIHETEDHVEIVIMSYHYELLVGHEKMSATSVLRVRVRHQQAELGGKKPQGLELMSVLLGRVRDAERRCSCTSWKDRGERMACATRRRTRRGACSLTPRRVGVA
eukprot:13841332-Heterocapsa_arctica.AAC.1